MSARRLTRRDDSALALKLREGAVGVLRTDTLYGLVATAGNQQAAERVYSIRGRAPEKPCIVLIAGEDQLLTPPREAARPVLAEYWPGPVSIVLPVDESVPAWLHRGTRTLAYRVPADDELRRLLAQTGPLLAPSANPADKPPARTVQEAEQYFGETADFYVDSGPVAPDTPPSKVLRVRHDGAVTRLR